MASRLVAMGGHLKGGPDLSPELGQEKVAVDVALNDQRADKLGTIGDTSVKAYEASLPDDGGAAQVIEQPADIERFAAAFFTWNGARTSPTTRASRSSASVPGAGSHMPGSPARFR